MLINLILLFQLIIFEDYKNLYEEFLKNKERCDLLEKNLEEIGKELDYYNEKKDFLKAKKLLKESHKILSEFTNCKKIQKLQEKKLENLLVEAKEEIEEEIEKILSLKSFSKKQAESLFYLIDKLSFLKADTSCPIISLKKIEISKEEPKEVIIEKLNVLKSILIDIKSEKEKTNQKLEELKKEKKLRENLYNFLKKMEIEGGILLDTRISSEDAIIEIKKINEKIESCQNASDLYKKVVNYWENSISEIEKQISKENGK